MDYDRWNGVKADVLAYFGYTASPPPPPPPEPPLFQAKCITTALYKRSGPGSSYSIIGALLLGDIVDVFEEQDGWFRIESGAEVWCSSSERYMQRVEPDPDPEPVLFRAKCIVNALYKRSGPGTTYKAVGYLTRDTVVDVYEVKNGWYRIGENAQVWCSGATQYMQRL